MKPLRQLRTRDALGDSLRRKVREALEGDSNDAEHEALAAVAEHFGVEYEFPF